RGVLERGARHARCRQLALNVPPPCAQLRRGRRRNGEARLRLRGRSPGLRVHLDDEAWRSIERDGRFPLDPRRDMVDALDVAGLEAAPVIQRVAVTFVVEQLQERVVPRAVELDLTECPRQAA